MRLALYRLDYSTKLIDTWEIEAPFILKPFIKLYIKKAVTETLQKLKLLLEKGEVVSQDCRKVVYR